MDKLTLTPSFDHCLEILMLVFTHLPIDDLSMIVEALYTHRGLRQKYLKVLRSNDMLFSVYWNQHWRKMMKIVASDWISATGIRALLWNSKNLKGDLMAVITEKIKQVFSP